VCNDTGVTSTAAGFRRVELTLAGCVPATLLRPATPRGLILFSNGFGAPREEAVPPGVAQNPISPPLVTGLLGAGYDVLVPENPAHGERLAQGETTVDTLLASFRGEAPNVLDTMQHETIALVDDLLARGIGTAGRIAAIGHSWGGLATLLRLAGDPRIGVGIALIPVVDPRCLDSLKPCASGPVLSRFELSGRLAPVLADRPLLIVTGAADAVAPAALTRATVAAIRVQGNPTALSHIELAGVGHEFTPEQLAVSLEWLDRHLPHDHPTSNGAKDGHA